MGDEITRYGPFALAIVAVSVLIARYPGYLGLSADRVRSSLLTFNAAFVLFVVLDLASDHALTSMTDLARTGFFILVACAAILIANIIVLYLQRRAPR